MKNRHWTAITFFEMFSGAVLILNTIQISIVYNFYVTCEDDVGFLVICEHVVGSPKHFSGNVPASVDKSCDPLRDELMEILMAQVGGLIP